METDYTVTVLRHLNVTYRVRAEDSEAAEVAVLDILRGNAEQVYALIEPPIEVVADEEVIDVTATEAIEEE